jgi:hypothetical protein
MPPISPGPRCLPPQETIERDPSRGAGSMERPPRWPTGRATALVHRGSKNPTRPATAPLFASVWQAGCASAASANVCFHEHDHGPLEHPGPPNPWLGRLPDRWRVASPPGRPPEVRRARGREKPISTLPTVIAHDGDFAPTPIAPGTSCREHRSSPCPERRGGRAGSPPPRLLAPQPRRKGRATPDFREEIRRSPTRGAFHRGTAGEGGAMSFARREPPGRPSGAFFTTRKPCEGRSPGSR